ncbi:MAG: HepT-like ribonuclease domain-containing protein [Balneolaceae bacterium]
MPHRTRKLLLDISFSCQDISGFIKDKSFEDFQGNRMLQLAIERAFEIIGEALYRLSKIDEATIAHKIPEYRQIIDLRNIIAHGYDIIDEAAMWDFAVNRVPSLLEEIQDF